MEHNLQRILQKLEELSQEIGRQNQRIGAIESRLGIMRERAAPNQPQRQIEMLSVKKEMKEVETESPINWRALEMTLGQYGLQVLGVGLFVLGMGFLLKYSIDMGWISPAVRVLFGLGCATALLALGEYVATSFKRWTSACIAGGLIIYGLSIYAACFFYQFITPSQAFVSLLGIALLVGALAVRHDSVLIAAMSVVGGFCIPVLIHAQIDKIYLATYVLGFAAVSLVLSYYKEWFALQIISGLSLCGYFAYLSFEFTLAQSLWFISCVMLLYMIYPSLSVGLFNRTHQLFEPCAVFVSGLLSCVSILSLLVFSTRESLFSRLAEYLNTLSTTQIVSQFLFCWGVLCAILLLFAAVKPKRNYDLLGVLFLMTGTSWLVSIHCHYMGHAKSIALCVYALGMLLLGLKVRWTFVRVFAYLVLLNALSAFIFAYHAATIELDSRIFNMINASSLALFSFLLITYYVLTRQASSISTDEKNMIPWIEGAAWGTVLYWLHSPVWSGEYWSLYQIGALVGYAGVLISIGAYLSSLPMRIIGYITSMFAIIYFLLNHDFLLAAPDKQGMLFVILALAVASTALVMFAFRSFKTHLTEAEIMFIQVPDVIGAGVILLVLRSLIIIQFRETSAQGLLFSGSARDTVGVVLTIYYSAYMIVMIVVGLYRRMPALRYFGFAIGLVVLNNLWFIVMGMRETLHRIGAFLVIGIFFIIASFLYQEASKRIKRD